MRKDVRNEIIRIGEDKKKETHEYHGYVTIQAKCIREYIIESKRAMAIYDTALEDLLMHTDMCSIGVTKGSVAKRIKNASNHKIQTI